MNIKEEVRKMKKVSPRVAALPLETRDRALALIKEKLNARQEEIFAENLKDLTEAEKNGVAPAVMKRLKFNEAKLADVSKGIDQLISLPDPLGKVTINRELDEGLLLRRVTCPIGVIGVVFEARPDALVQISTLCIKSGNCAILKGGRETTYTNRILFSIIYACLLEAGYPENCMLQAEQHNEIDELLQCDGLVDLLIPRGSNSFVQYIMNNTRIPVMGHADGICHIYVDSEANQEEALRIIADAKTQYTAACNAVETLLVDRSIAAEFLPKLSAMLQKEGVALSGTTEVTDLIGGETIGDEGFIEYLALIVSVKLVSSLEEAVDHINRFGSHHTDCIITESDEKAEEFMELVDSAGVYRNCSTRFADGFRYGFGAEVGISTGKIHARGPVGLEGLVTYKYKLYGHGQIVGDYASGKSEFHFKDIEI
ncbi:MAG: glutamate-5-semialdehyde dehydrogenase [Blautia sp.]|nr:glutamate-5-semialdehyde dehydrogenase [Blautia sp.]